MARWQGRALFCGCLGALLLVVAVWKPSLKSLSNPSLLILQGIFLFVVLAVSLDHFLPLLSSSRGGSATQLSGQRAPGSPDRVEVARRKQQLCCQEDAQRKKEEQARQSGGRAQLPGVPAGAGRRAAGDDSLTSASPSRSLEEVRRDQQQRLEAEADAKLQQTRAEALVALRAKAADVDQARADRSTGFASPGDELKWPLAPAVREAQALRAQQDKELEESLQKDRAKASAAEHVRDMQAAAKERRARLRAGLPAEPGVGQEGRVRIGIRFPDGCKELRAWMRTDTVSQLYDWVESMDGTSKHAPGGYCLATSFPRQTMAREAWGSKSLEEAGLHPEALLLLESHGK